MSRAGRIYIPSNARFTSAGYSLFELLVVLAVIAFAAMLTPAVMGALRPELQIEKIAGDTRGVLQLARSRAIFENESVLTGFEVNDGRLRIDDGDWIELPRGVIIEISDNNPATSVEHGVIFYPDGSASGLDIRFAGGKRIFVVTTSLNGKTTVTKESN